MDSNEQTNQTMSFLNDLRAADINYHISQHRDDALMVEVAVPGERWEVEFLADGSVEAERFGSDGTIFGSDALGDLIVRHRK